MTFKKKEKPFCVSNERISIRNWYSKNKMTCKIEFQCKFELRFRLLAKWLNKNGSHAKYTTQLNFGNHFRIICYWCLFALIWSKCEKLMFSVDNIVPYLFKCLWNKLSYSKKEPKIFGWHLCYASVLISFPKNVRPCKRHCCWPPNGSHVKENVNHTTIGSGTIFLSFTWLQHTHYGSHKDVVHISRWIFLWD